MAGTYGLSGEKYIRTQSFVICRDLFLLFLLVFSKIQIFEIILWLSHWFFSFLKESPYSNEQYLTFLVFFFLIEIILSIFSDQIIPKDAISFRQLLIIFSYLGRVVPGYITNDFQLYPGVLGYYVIKFRLLFKFSILADIHSECLFF